MNKEEITISDLIRLIESGKKVRLKGWLLAQFFGVYESAINANVRVLIQSNVVKPSPDCGFKQSSRILLPEVYDLEMIIALAFRINSPKTAEFREWVLKKMIHKIEKRVVIFHQINDLQMLN